MISVDTSARAVTGFGQTVRCAIGKGGTILAAQKREGDGATPLGVWPIRTALLRPDRVAAPASALPWRWLRPNDGWSDDPRDPQYNRPVTHPHPFSAERLWRTDGLYDIILILGHNDAPPVPGHGSAIFLHCAAPDFTATEGCVAVEHEVLSGWLTQLGPADTVNFA